MVQKCTGTFDENFLISHWHRIVTVSKHTYAPLKISDGPVSTLPGAIHQIIDDIFKKLTRVDYRDRSATFDSIFARLDIALRVLGNSQAEARARKIRRDRRRNRMRKVSERKAKALLK
jgi:hypothetical protein